MEAWIISGLAFLAVFLAVIAANARVGPIFQGNTVRAEHRGSGQQIADDPLLDPGAFQQSQVRGFQIVNEVGWAQVVNDEWPRNALLG